MSEKKRLFIGVKVGFTEKTAKFYHSIPEILGEAKVKWVELNNIHVTLKFLGDVSTEKIQSVSTRLSIVSKRFKEFEALLKGIGIFKDFYHPKVIWFGLRNYTEFEKLKNEIENSLSDLGFEIDYRRFAPHLTAGRFKEAGSAKELMKLVSVNQDVYFQVIPVKEIILFESILKAEGPEYKVIESFPLGMEEEFKEFKF
ncbi:MAG: RNA 2',3'-cyclic phosphodiesterase [Candidatus Delongbacteria bacterium]|nr:RNA 2',3'-cyclic phosphodiesterase [Candidatus Delongbacteria bacterium]MCG2761277.1 RNA 2',3'-cyclic phosphodiesterase [Candidatus Delongbacteria bacterium]